jgi:hypothetical protein
LLRRQFILNAVRATDVANQIKRVHGVNGFENLAGLMVNSQTFEMVGSEIQARKD